MRTKILQQIIDEHPDTAILVANKYKVLAAMTQRLYPELKDIKQSHLADILFDAIQADRELREINKDKDLENKKILEQQYLLDKGYTPGYHEDVKQLNLYKTI